MKINLKKLQESINKDANLIYEGLNTTEAKKLYSLVVDLYEEINSFEKDAPPAAINALSPHLNHVHEMLESMLREPLNYVSHETDEGEEDEELEQDFDDYSLGGEDMGPEEEDSKDELDSEEDPEDQEETEKDSD